MPPDTNEKTMVDKHPGAGKLKDLEDASSAMSENPTTSEPGVADPPLKDMETEVETEMEMEIETRAPANGTTPELHTLPRVDEEWTPGTESDNFPHEAAPTPQATAIAPPVQHPGPLKKRGRKSFREIDAALDLIDIPEDDVLFQKQYYAISEVAQWFKVNTSLLRFWESEFDILKPRKNRKGDRLFRPEDVKNLQVIYYLLRNRKFTIEGAKEYLKTNRKKAAGNIQVIQSLTKFRSFLVELRANLD